VAKCLRRRAEDQPASVMGNGFCGCTFWRGASVRGASRPALHLRREGLSAAARRRGVQGLRGPVAEPLPERRQPREVQRCGWGSAGRRWPRGRRV